MREIVWGIIGCGDVTEVKSGPAFNRIEGSRLAAVMRRDAAKAEDYAKRHGVPRWYGDANDLLDDPEINAVYVATPPSAHREAVEAALARGLPVMVEKPLAHTIDDAAAMVAAAKANRVPLTVAYYRRALPRFEKMRDLALSGAIGTVEAIQVMQVLSPDFRPAQAWKTDPKINGGGLFVDMQSHTLDWLRYVFGDPVRAEVWVRKFAGGEGSERLVVGTIGWERGFGASLLGAYSAEPALERVSILGSQGTLEMGFFRGSPLILRRSDGEEIIDLPDPPHVHQPFVERTVAYFRGTSPNPCGGEEALATTRLLSAWMNP